MPIKTTRNAYGSVAKCLHWLMAALIIGMIALGFIMNTMHMGPDKIRLIGLHKATGVTILALALLRLLWRLANTVPSLPRGMRVAEKLAAHASHYALYALMFAMPMSGWVMSSAAGFPVSVFGLFTLPNLVAPDRGLAKAMVTLHSWLAWALIGLIALHAAAALLHHVVYKDTVLRRMLPFATLPAGRP